MYARPGGVTDVKQKIGSKGKKRGRIKGQVYRLGLGIMVDDLLNHKKELVENYEKEEGYWKDQVNT